MEQEVYGTMTGMRKETGHTGRRQRVQQNNQRQTHRGGRQVKEYKRIPQQIEGQTMRQHKQQESDRESDGWEEWIWAVTGKEGHQ